MIEACSVTSSSALIADQVKTRTSDVPLLLFFLLRVTIVTAVQREQMSVAKFV
jgi:hypothetical protein